MKKILIINLARMGDLLQSTPLLEEIKKESPDSRITMLANSKFAAICERLPFIDEIIKFDVEEIAKSISESNKNLIEIYKDLKNKIESLNRKGFSKIINLTHSKMSAFLMSLLDCNDKNGITVDPNGFRVIKNDWMIYFFNAAINRRFNPFNLVDMYLLTTGKKNSIKSLLLELHNEDIAEAENFYAAKNVKKDDLLIGLQPGASKSHKQWPVKNFAQVASKIKKIIDAKIVVFGTSAESHLAEEIRKIAGEDIIDATGVTTMKNLPAFISRCRMLITNDTGTMHIASAVNVPVIEISIGPVNYTETGPYGEGHYVIQTNVKCSPCSFNVKCKNEICKETVLPEEVIYTIKAMLGYEEMKNEKPKTLFLNSNLFYSRFDSEGFLEFVSPFPLPLNKTLFWKEIYRIFWEYVYFGKEHDETLESNIDVRFGKYYFENDFIVEKESKKIIERIDEIIELAEEGKEIIKKIIRALTESPDAVSTDISLLAKRVTEIDAEIYRLSLATEELLPICDVYRMKRESIDDPEATKVSWKCLALMEELQNNCRFFKKVIYKTFSSEVVQRKNSKKGKISFQVIR
ncbi:MAG: glycosyltransferase family 9 protein [Candidatus Schekmanbacteria bacterium]|nr:MAG: glycosyltransferase family 9 protein [Candidatus Schekmanbacteria bacterium]